MGKFHGNIEGLQSKVAEHGLIGQWSETLNAHKFTAVDGGILLWYNSTHTLQCQGKGASKTKIDELILQLDGKSIIESKPSPEVDSSEITPTAFIVYGHDDTSREQLELILNKMNINHFILGKTSGKGLTLIEALESQVGKNGTANAGIVLLTPDDVGYSKRAGVDEAKDRARQNVILEMGMLIAKLGRTHTMILVKGDIERPSDTDGIIYLGFQKHVKEVIPKLAERLESCGFTVDYKKVTDASK
jgi:predicted nucleotide-binding protein